MEERRRRRDATWQESCHVPECLETFSGHHLPHEAHVGGAHFPAKHHSPRRMRAVDAAHIPTPAAEASAAHARVRGGASGS
mmetsp:Transcript_11747/g.40140  ORF Transcript_11747/g.40140 Transcript_11747/m.40140 type:complete len:81 (-) Transcript_11747:303-545(-)